MEFSVRYVRLGEGNQQGPERPVLGLRGKKSAYLIIEEDDRIRSISVPLKDFDKSSPCTFHGEPYPIPRYLEAIEKYKKRKPISARADHLVQLAYAGGSEAIDEDLLSRVPEDLLPTTDGGEHPGGDLGLISEAIGAAAAARRSGAKAKIAAPPRPSPGKPAKAAAITPPKRGRGRPPGGGGGLIASIANELDIHPAWLRKACRAAGLHAPYTDAKAIRSAWTKHGKKK